MNPELKQVQPISVISRRDRLTIPQIPAHSGPAIHSLIEALNRLNVSPASSDIIYIYHGLSGNPAEPFDLEICLPVDADVAGQVPAPLSLKSTPVLKCMAVDYVGGMPGIGAAWMGFIKLITTAGHVPEGQCREIYKKWVDFDSAENVTELQQGIA